MVTDEPFSLDYGVSGVCRVAKEHCFFSFFLCASHLHSPLLHSCLGKKFLHGLSSMHATPLLLPLVSLPLTNFSTSFLCPFPFFRLPSPSLAYFQYVFLHLSSFSVSFIDRSLCMNACYLPTSQCHFDRLSTGYALERMREEKTTENRKCKNATWILSGCHLHPQVICPSYLLPPFSFSSLLALRVEFAQIKCTHSAISLSHQDISCL